jgi:hypothetical protein
VSAGAYPESAPKTGDSSLPAPPERQRGVVQHAAPIPSCERTVPLTCTTLALIRQKTGIAVNVSWTTSG